MARPSTTHATVLLLHGEERFLITESARATLDAWKADLVPDFGFGALGGTGTVPGRRPAVSRRRELLGAVASEASDIGATPRRTRTVPNY